MKSSKSLNFSAGTILWLPAKNDIANEHLDAAGTIDDGCFDHPVLILAVKPGKKEVVILMITSFGGKDLLERHPRNALTRSQHLPIYPSKIHPDNGSQLFLVNNSGLHRNSYIKIEVQRTIKSVLLRRTRHSTCALRPDSYDYLIKVIGFTPPPPSPKPHTRIFSSKPNALLAPRTWSNIAHSTPVHYTNPAPAHFAYPTPTYSAPTVSTRPTKSTPTPNHYTQPALDHYTPATPYHYTPNSPNTYTPATPSPDTPPTTNNYTPPTTNNYTPPTTSPYTTPTPITYTPPTTHNYTPPTPSPYTPPTPNRHTRPIPAYYIHPAPTLSTHSNSRSSHVHWQTERTPLLPTVYNQRQPYRQESPDCSGGSSVILFIAIAAFIGWAVWKMAGGGW